MLTLRVPSTPLVFLDPTLTPLLNCKGELPGPNMKLGEVPDIVVLPNKNGLPVDTLNVPATELVNRGLLLKMNCLVEVVTKLAGAEVDEILDDIVGKVKLVEVVTKLAGAEVDEILDDIVGKVKLVEVVTKLAGAEVDGILDDIVEKVETNGLVEVVVKLAGAEIDGIIDDIVGKVLLKTNGLVEVAIKLAEPKENEKEL